MDAPPAPSNPEIVLGKAGPNEVYQRLDTTSPAPYPRDWYPRKLAWELVRLFLFRPTPRRLNAFRVWLLRRFGARIAPTAVVRSSARVWHPWIFSMGEFSCLAENVLIYNLGPVSIGDHTVISQNAEVCAGTHDYRRRELPLQRPPIAIGNGVWVCARAFIGPGVRIGDNAIVGACAVVSRDVPATAIVAGNPARVVKTRPPPQPVPPTTPGASPA